MTDKTAHLTSKDEWRRWRVLMGLLCANATRGRDSAGLGVLTADHVCRIVKGAMHPVDFARWPKVQEIKEQRPVLVMGHTRLATMGAVTSRNAHPFRCGGIVGAHNGIITNARQLYADVEVDSQAALRLIEDRGVKALSELTGTAALTWLDMHDGTFGMYRHSSPLHAVYIPAMATLFWNSEFDLLCRVLHTEDVKHGYQVLIEPDKVYRFRHAYDVPEGLPVKMRDAAYTTDANIDWEPLHDWWEREGRAYSTARAVSYPYRRG